MDTMKARVEVRRDSFACNYCTFGRAHAQLLTARLDSCRRPGHVAWLRVPASDVRDISSQEARSELDT